MSVEFNDEQNIARVYTSRRILGQSETPGMARMLLKMGIIKNEGQAVYAFATIIIGCMILSIFLLAYFVYGVKIFSGGGTPNVTQQREIISSMLHPTNLNQ